MFQGNNWGYCNCEQKHECCPCCCCECCKKEEPKKQCASIKVCIDEDDNDCYCK